MRFGSDKAGYYIGLAVDGGEFGRVCLATAADTTSNYHLGSVVIVQQAKAQFISSNHKVKPILLIAVHPNDLGLVDNWCESVAEKVDAEESLVPPDSSAA